MHCEIHNASRYELSKMCETNLPLCEAIIKLLRRPINTKYNNAIILETRIYINIISILSVSNFALIRARLRFSSMTRRRRS